MPVTRIGQLRLATFRMGQTVIGYMVAGMVLALDGWLRLHNIQTRDMVYLLLFEVALFSAPLGLLAILVRRWMGREPHWTMPGTWASAAVILVYILVRREHLPITTAIHAGWIFYGAVAMAAMGFLAHNNCYAQRLQPAEKPAHSDIRQDR
ncbi:hypothetical protein HAP94_07155 [Acidithiobacillus ferrivorans]|nr:hypothetical protein [Acidithiobacillus ferrivorans]